VGRWNDRPDDTPDDWRGWKNGKYDNRYGGYPYSRGGYAGSGRSTIYFRNRKRGSKIAIVVIVSLILGIGFWYFNPTELNFRDLIPSEGASRSSETAPTLDNSESYDVEKTGCIMTSSGLGDIIVNCHDGQNYYCKSSSPVKSMIQKAGIIQDVTLRIADNLCNVEYFGNSGNKITKSFIVSSKDNVDSDTQSKVPEKSREPKIEVPSIVTKATDTISKSIDTLAKPQQSTIGQAEDAIKHINQKRAENGKNPISHDSRVYQLALARVKDMYDYNYLDHTNPTTGTCPYNMKSDFGLSSNENVAENAHLTTIDGVPSLFNPPMTQVVDGWMGSTGHRMNLLSYEHVAGSVACYGGYCVFLGLNHGNYGEGCHTAAEGMAYAKRFDACTPQQMSQFDSLNQEYNRLYTEYNKLHKFAMPEIEYQQSMAMYQKLRNHYNQIINFRC
jgi:uncharacterized protein YkwD